MDYRERVPAAPLAGLVKCFWTLDAGGRPGEWIAHEATPDGCIEVIRRRAGRSRWDSPQPETFVAGLNDRPVRFEISGDARFAAIRLWPWAWPLVGEASIVGLRNGWRPANTLAAVEIAAALPDFDAAERLLVASAGALPPGLAATGEKLARSRTVVEMRDSTGFGGRALQRWFAARVGMPPRQYLRLLRFQDAFAALGAEARLADQAAEHGFADQPHMAREFRTMTGTSARKARRTAKGPFLN